jgi:hypothetical protein
VTRTGNEAITEVGRLTARVAELEREDREIMAAQVDHLNEMVKLWHERSVRAEVIATWALDQLEGWWRGTRRDVSDPLAAIEELNRLRDVLASKGRRD